MCSTKLSARLEQLSCLIIVDIEIKMVIRVAVSIDRYVCHANPSLFFGKFSIFHLAGFWYSVCVMQFVVEIVAASSRYLN